MVRSCMLDDFKLSVSDDYTWYRWALMSSHHISVGAMAAMTGQEAAPLRGWGGGAESRRSVVLNIINPVSVLLPVLLYSAY